MSTQVLGDVELVTKQELEAALDAVVVPEDDINSKIEAAGVVLEQAIATAKTEVHSEVELSNAALAQETANRTAKDTELTDMIHDEAQLRETTDDALRSRIEREEGVREAADTEITQLVSQETKARAEGDANTKAEILAELIITENQSFEDTVFCGRMTNLPIAQATIEVHDSSIAVGDILATVGARYLPAIPVSANFVAELTDGCYYISVRMDTTGNVFVVNKTKLEGVYEGNVNSVTVMYLTKE